MGPVYCFTRPNHGRKPDVAFVRFDRLSGGVIPKGDLFIAPDVVIEVLSPHDTAVEVEAKLEEYLLAGVQLVWIVNPEPRTIRVYRQNETTRVFRAGQIMENEPLLPGFRLAVSDVFPMPAPT